MMNTDQPPSHQEWKALYYAAIEFKKVAPWDWMHDTDIFGVQDPVSDETGYCCIMGAAGEHFALGVYLGEEGLAGIMRIVSGDISPYDGEALFIQKCLKSSSIFWRVQKSRPENFWLNEMKYMDYWNLLLQYWVVKLKWSRTFP